MKNYPIILRDSYFEFFQQVVESQRGEFVAIYGRRRVGKTTLLRYVAKDLVNKSLFITGEFKGQNARQLAVAQRQIEQDLYDGEVFEREKNWKGLFELLVKGIEQYTNDPGNTIAIVLDELPWLAGKKSDLLSAIDYYWNTKLQWNTKVKFFICGSAASWIINKIIRDKGGLHNRLTRTLKLAKFSFRETKDFLKQVAPNWSYRDILETYITFGGVPYYLSLIDGMQSPTQNIARLIFSESAPLKDEFKVMLEALFGSSADFIRIIQALGRHRHGLTRQQISEESKIGSGTRLTDILEQLEEAGFIMRISLYGKKNRGAIYRLTDELSFFWSRFLDSSKDLGLEEPQKAWLQQRQSQSYLVWAGYAFENACLNNVSQIKSVLGFSDVISWSGPARIKLPTKQLCKIDLLFDRADRTVTLVEIKYNENETTIDRELCESIKRKCDILSKFLSNKKSIQPVLLTKERVHKSLLLEEFQIRAVCAEEIFV